MSFKKSKLFITKEVIIYKMAHTKGLMQAITIKIKTLYT